MPCESPDDLVGNPLGHSRKSCIIKIMSSLVLTPPLLSVRGLTRNFSSVAALVNLTFDLAPGEVLGVVGQRGSGKSTLFRLLSGVIPPSEGEILLNGKRVHLRTPSQAQHLGIETVFQNPELADNLLVLHNIFLGRETHNRRRLSSRPDDQSMAEAARAFLASFELPETLLQQKPGSLSHENRQLIALARAMVRPGRLLLLDDVLAPLSYTRQNRLLEHIHKLSAQNVAVIISSDDLKHLFEVTDRILVLYQGRALALRSTAETSAREIVELIVGTNRQAQITPVIWAFENYHAAQQQAEELRKSQQVLRLSLEAQDSLNQQLIERLHDQVQALDRLNLALQEANRRLMTEREGERKALARDLHDQVIQDLLSFNYQLEDAETSTTDEAQRQTLAEIRGGIRSVVSSLRQVCSDLRPPTIDSHGLPAAIRSLVHQWSRQSGIPVELGIQPDLGRLPETIELSVFRIIQEGLSNVRKHANATQVRLELSRTPTASLVVRLVDNGQGISQPLNLGVLSEEKHFGLIGVSERVSLLGGRMQVKAHDGLGLELLIEIPSPDPTYA
jgi:signal transduction histidine kinase